MALLCSSSPLLRFLQLSVAGLREDLPLTSSKHPPPAIDFLQGLELQWHFNKPIQSILDRCRVSSTEESSALFNSESHGRCVFRALVKGMALNKGVVLSSREERENADELRMAVKEAICDGGKERLQYEEALIAITIEESLRRYCQRIGRPDFWGGESELLVLSKLCTQPITVYIPEREHGGRGHGWVSVFKKFRERETAKSCEAFVQW